MKTLKLVDIEKVEVGDQVVINYDRLTIHYIDDEPHGRDMTFVSPTGNKIHRFIPKGEKITIEL